jgi:7tm Odorant receptor
MDTIFFGSCLHIATHCDILRESFDGDKKKFVEKHLKILDLAKQLNDLYKPIVFEQLLATNVLLCMIGFQVVMTKTYIEILFVAPYGIATLNQLIVYCFGGQLVLDKIASVSGHFYDSDKELVIIIRNTLKGFQIKSAVCQANLPMFTAILGSAQGLITALKSFT